MRMRILPTNFLAGIAFVLVIYTVFFYDNALTDDQDAKSGSKIKPAHSQKSRSNNIGLAKDFNETEVKNLPGRWEYNKPENLDLKAGAWQIVKEKNEEKDIYLYSAYLDERKTIEHPTIRVLGIKKEGEQEMFCLLWYEHIAVPDVVSAVKTVIGKALTVSPGKAFHVVIFSCGIPDSDKQSPIQVSILTDLEMNPSNILQVTEPEKPLVPIDFGLCTGPIKDIETKMLIEWMEILKIWGIGEITLYNSTLSDETAYVVNSYVYQEIVALKSASLLFEGEEEEILLLYQTIFLNDCMYRNLYRYKALMVLTFGELIVPKTGTNYFEMIVDIQNEQPSEHPATAYRVRNVFFYTDLPPLNPNTYLITQKYLYRTDTRTDYGEQNGRTIFGPQTCVAMNSHNCTLLVPKYDVKGSLVYVKDSLALNHNYVMCDLDSKYNEPGLCANKTGTVHRDESMTDFNLELISKTAEELFKLNLEHSVMGIAPQLDSSANDALQLKAGQSWKGMDSHVDAKLLATIPIDSSNGAKFTATGHNIEVPAGSPGQLPIDGSIGAKLTATGGNLGGHAGVPEQLPIASNLAAKLAAVRGKLERPAGLPKKLPVASSLAAKLAASRTNPGGSPGRLALKLTSAGGKAEGLARLVSHQGQSATAATSANLVPHRPGVNADLPAKATINDVLSLQAALQAQPDSQYLQKLAAAALKTLTAKDNLKPPGINKKLTDQNGKSTH